MRMRTHRMHQSRQGTCPPVMIVIVAVTMAARMVVRVVVTMGVIVARAVDVLHAPRMKD